MFSATCQKYPRMRSSRLSPDVGSVFAINGKCAAEQGFFRDQLSSFASYAGILLHEIGHMTSGATKGA